MRAPAARMMHWNDYSIVTIMARVKLETISLTIQSSKTILVRAHHRAFQRNPLKMQTVVSHLKSISVKVIINQFITRLCRHKHHRLHNHHHHLVRVKITISTRTILHMHIQIHTNLAKYEAHMKKRRHEILPTYFCTLLIYEQNYTSLLYTQLRIVLLLQLHLFIAVNKL